MSRQIKDTLMVILGWVFIVLGLAGLVLPILQGILFLLIGLLLLSKKSSRARFYLSKIKNRYPSIYSRASRGREKLGWYFARFIRRG